MKKHTYLRTLLFVALFFIAGMVRAQVIVVATAATPGPTVYPDLTSAFAAINAGTHQGAIGVAIMANSTEAAPCVLNSSGAGAALYTSVIIGPGADGVTLSCATATGRGVIELKGADNVTIDGDNPNTAGINRNLTILNTAANTITFTSCVRVATAATVVTSADGIIVRNCILTGNATGRNLTGVTSTTGSENTTFGIYAGGNGGATATDAPTAITSVTTNTAVAATTINTLLVDNNVISACARGVVFNGANATVSTGVVVSNNTIGGSGALTVYPFTAPSTTVYTKGIWINGTNAISVTGNTVQNILSYVAIPMTGIELVSGIGSGTILVSNNIVNGVALNGTSANAAKGILINNAGGPYTISGNTISTIQNNGSTSSMGIEVITGAASGMIEKNIISGVYARSTGGYGAFGIQLNGGNAVTVQNNFISDLNAVDNNSATSTLGPMGIRIVSGINHKIYYNSVNLYGPVLAGGSFAEPSACLIVTSTAVTGLEVINNAFQNTRTGSFSGSVNVCMDLPSGMTSSANYTINNNAYYSPVGTGYFIAIISSGTTYTAANFNPAVITPATNWRSYTSALNAAGTNDNASLASSAAAPFISNSNLHINIGAANVADLDTKGVVIATIATDIDGSPRNASTPDIGADEFVVPACVSASGGTISPATQTTCANSTVVMTSTGATAGTGITYQWKFANVSGGPYSNVVGGSGATTISYTTAALTAGTYYYVLQTTCSFGPVTGLSNELTVTVNPAPTVGVTPTTGTICSVGGAPVVLTASGGVTYTWSPTTGLTPSTGSPVSANPGATTTYTVTGTDGSGCTATASATVNVVETPSVVSPTATPSSVCSGGNSQLLAAGALTSSYALSTITPNIITPVSPTTVTGWLADADDGSAGPYVMPFSFNFFGATYNQVFVGTNGYISFSNLSAVSAANLRTAQTLPNATAPNNMVALCMGDLNQAAPGVVRVFTTGTAPYRVYVIDFTTVPFYGVPNTGSVSGQIQLFESTNIVEVHVSNVAHGTSTSNITLGIENATGTAGSSPVGRIASVWNVSTPEAYRWSPSGAGTFTYVWTPATFLNSTTIANPLASGITATTTYSVTASSSGCASASSSVTITAGSALSSTSSATPSSTVCAGSNLTFNSAPVGGGAPYTYAWTGPNSFASILQNPVITGVTVAATGTYTISVTDACGAVSTTSVTITVNPLPAISVTPTSATYCTPGSPVALSATGAGPFTWGPAAGLSATTGANVTASPSASTTYTVSMTDGNGCTASTTSAISVSETPVVSSVTATPSSVCNGGNSQLLATASTASFYTQSSTTFTPINSGTGTTVLCNATVVTTPLTGGTLDDGYWNGITLPFTFNYFGTNFNSINVQTNGAVSMVPFTTTTGYNVTMPSTADPNNLIAACFGDLDWRFGNGVISCYTSGIAPNRVFVINYNGNTGGGFYNSGVAPVVFVNTQVQLFETTNIIQVHSLGINGVTAVNHAQGLENAGGTIGVIVPGRNNGATWTATNDAVQFVPTVINYSWAPPTFLNNPAIANPMATAITANTTYTVTTTVGGCTSSGTVTITAGSALTSTNSAAPGNTVCSGTNVTLNVTATGGGLPYTYSWSGPNSFASIAQSPVITGATTAASGTYTIIVTDACGATSSTSVTLTVNPLPTVAVTPTTALYCNPGTPVALTATGAPGFTWGPAAGLSATTGASVNATPTVTTTYTVTGTDANGCVATATTTITSAQAVTNAGATATPGAICVGSTTTLAAAADPITAIVLSENFNAGAPTWTRTNTSTGGTPANAAWTNRPDAYVYASGTPYHSNDNTQFVQTNSDAQGSGSTTRVTLQSPAFSTVGNTNLSLDFYQYYRDINDNGDSAVIESSLDGINWTIVTAITATSGSEAVFTHPVVTLPVGLNNQPTVYIRFRFIATWDWYWSIDNVTISGLAPNFIYSWTSSPVGFTSTAASPTHAPTASTSYTVQISTAAGCSATASTSVTVNPLPSVALSGTTTFCAGGSSLLTGTSGGTSQWYLNGAPIIGANSNTYLATAAGVYNMTKTNTNGCFDSASTGITVIVNPLPTVVANATAITLCNGDAVTLNGSGATTYTWAAAMSVTNNVAFTPSATDTYTVTGTDGNGCQDTDMITVTVNPLPTVVANATATAVCDGTPVTVSGSGATTYTWAATISVTDNVAFTPTATDTYTVTGTDGNGCQNTDMITVTVNALPTVVANATATTVCENTPVTLSGSGATTYTWTGSVTDNVPFNATVTDTYTVTGTDGNGCTDIDMVTVTVNPLPVVTVSFIMDTVCLNGGLFALTGETPTGGTWSGPGVSGSNFDPIIAGLGWQPVTYSYTDANSCTGSLTDSLNVDVCGGVIPVAFVNGVTVYPNPNEGQFTIQLSSLPTSSVQVEVTNELGQVISAFTMTGTTKEVNISTLESGVYFVRVINEGVVSVHRVVKQ